MTKKEDTQQTTTTRGKPTSTRIHELQTCDAERYKISMSERKLEEEEAAAAATLHRFKDYHNQQLYQHQMQQQAGHDAITSLLSGDGGGGRAAGLMFPEVSPILPWSLPPVHTVNPAHSITNPLQDHHGPFLFPPPPSSASSSYAGYFSRRPASLQFSYDGPSPGHLRILSDEYGPVVQPGSAHFGLQAELNKLTAQEITDAKALAASKSHSEAERRRRERINNHLAKLRSLLPSTAKTDKASLLAEVITHVKELKHQTSQITETSPVPTEADELTVDASDDDGKFVIKASLCCQDRSDLLPDLIKTLKSLRLKTLKAEIAMLRGRVKNVLVVAGEEGPTTADNSEQQQYSLSSIQEALKAVMEKSGADESNSARAKRQRNNINIIEHKSL
ncbi:hypothetical protein Nepgr_017063 [Nepenthes gracilis]|uniref:BHLH domain-containing protein n=1 Tax=Nepenthes gracilis TaxID=150966 RepID=A0AAD3XRU5_NEPGR|nr:hypothetical protein Nepgr_017063 [Nepenthes gracilis]